MPTISRLLGGLVLTGCPAAGCVDTAARGNNIALCVVVPDMPRLSLDGARAPSEQLFGWRPTPPFHGGGETISGWVSFVLVGLLSDAEKQPGLRDPTALIGRRTVCWCLHMWSRFNPTPPLREINPVDFMVVLEDNHQ